jgi:hypothetical protein
MKGVQMKASKRLLWNVLSVLEYTMGRHAANTEHEGGSNEGIEAFTLERSVRFGGASRKCD